jgi:3-methyladenine DNA glycosylase AlkD
MKKANSTKKTEPAWSKTAVVRWLKDNADPRGVQHWERLGESRTAGLKSFGLGLTKLRKFAKQIGRDPALAARLWESDVYDCKIIALLIDDPKRVTRQQAEQQVESLHAGMLSHVFSSCDATLAKTPFAFELACDWKESRDPVRRRCAYGLFYELSKKNPKGMDDGFLLALIERIEREIRDEEMWVRESMNSALMGIGKRNKTLNQAAIRAAKNIGPVEIDYGDDNACEPLDVLKHLTSDHLKKKFGN